MRVGKKKCKSTSLHLNRHTSNTCGTHTFLQFSMVLDRCGRNNALQLAVCTWGGTRRTDRALFGKWTAANVQKYKGLPCSYRRV